MQAISLILLLAAPALAMADGTCGYTKYNPMVPTRKMGYTPKTPYIVGGTDSLENEFPSIVSMWFGASHTCGGIIIASNVVMTAAHCTTGSLANPASWTLYAGRQLLRTPGTYDQIVKVSSIVRHQNYSALRQTNDIAFMITTTPFAWTDGVQPTCLPAANAGDLTGDSSVCAGWGAMREGGAVASTLQKVTLPIVSNTACLVSYPGSITDSMVCAGYPAGGMDSCQGDSGGPLYITDDATGQQIAAGIVSWGSGCARAGYYGVYTRVTSFLDWINANSPTPLGN